MAGKAGTAIFLFVLIACLRVTAQSDFILSQQRFNPHILQVNPAFLPEADFFLGMPVLSNAYANFGNNSFTYRDLVKRKNGSDSVYFDFDGLLSGMRQSNFINTTASVDWLSFGWKEGRYYLSANITEKFNLRTRFSKNLINTAVNGNAQFIGQTVDLGNLYLNASHYREYGVGISRDFNCRFRLGITGKFLQGMENIDIARSNVKLNTADVTFDLSGTSDILINTSGIDEFSRDSLTRWTYLFNRGNRGWAIDLGGEYLFSDNLSVYASVLDIGQINWKYNPVNRYNQVPEFSFSGISIQQFFTNNSDTIVNGVQQYLDSLGQLFSIQKSHNAYTSNLPGRFYLGGRYKFKSTNEFSALIYGNMFRGVVYPSVSAGFSKRFSEILEFNVNWSYHNHSLANLGTGVCFNLGLTQFQIATDNIIGLFGQYRTRSVNLRAGINLVANYLDTPTNYCDWDGDGVENKLDDCPREPGPLVLNGCPDRDQDGIADKFDECPGDYGTLEFKGCPDRDYDKVMDKLDKCPDEKGLVELNGCPDRDNDKVADKEDECPNVFGLAIFKGCPDRDNDSIPDKEDQCPDQKGSRYFGGCPDTDGDSITDNLDQCPEDKGPSKYQGCPDTDGDGVYDRIDLCPDDSGLVRLKGCPEVKDDQDGDGIKDADDACPTRPGLIENRGCPVLDSDGDGVTDEMDKCPTVPGIVENSGCPDLKASEKAILKTAFNNLEFETGKSVIKAESFKSLNELALLLILRPEWSLIISGHTDNVGKPAANMLLSKNRALAVKRYLAEQGVDRQRLQPDWFGQTEPVGSNATTQGRQKNRRVEMKVVF